MAKAKKTSRAERIQAMRDAHSSKPVAVPPSKAAQKKLTTALGALRKKHGADVITTVGAGHAHVEAGGIKTPWYELDDLLTGSTDANDRTVPGSGVGLPRGRILEIYGPEACGKTTLTLHLIAEAQKQGSVCAFVDAEHALDVKYAKKLGVSTQDLLLSQPDNAEQALDVIVDLAKSGAVDVIVLDSVAAMVPEAEDKADMEKSHVALQARLMGKVLRKLVGAVKRSNCVVIFINQTRMKIGVMFGNPETTTGGNALKFYASVRIEVRHVKTIKKGGVKIGGRSRIKTVKNKAAPPFRELHVDIRPNRGICAVYGDPDLGGNDGDE